MGVVLSQQSESRMADAAVLVRERSSNRNVTQFIRKHIFMEYFTGRKKKQMLVLQLRSATGKLMNNDRMKRKIVTKT
ncbi:hypothetical protein Y032_0482g2280 [Ancylostoma ceylanicum]|uniref:Uncharacterized protein n=1 Tax=Ancylostoma ceylanicum TaxID=53326 RepID=A0A016WV95_9BILA|nr:hypothetical protein Y032_0482g2280 [Ancylostoma ceylanicum]